MRISHIISTQQFLDINFLNEIFRLADDSEERDRKGTLQPILKGKILASLFYEPSTRTRFSFETAMQKLGGSVISTENAQHFSSAIKGESLVDTIKVVGEYADVIVLRHHTEGSSKSIAEFSNVPVINAGDGSGEHPTQALLDLYTIQKEFGSIDGLKIAFVGDLLYGRTVHSLVYLLSLYKNVKIILVSLEQFKLPEKYKRFLQENNIYFEESTSLNDILNDIDVLYVTRVQKERFESGTEYEKVKDTYIIDQSVLKRMKERAIIMHPLPRVNEIHQEVDKDRRAVYFKQAKNGLYIRMALLQMLLA